jgi:hypothetical protein
MRVSRPLRQANEPRWPGRPPIRPGSHCAAPGGCRSPRRLARNRAARQAHRAQLAGLLGRARTSTSGWTRVPGHTGHDRVDDDLLPGLDPIALGTPSTPTSTQLGSTHVKAVAQSVLIDTSCGADRWWRETTAGAGGGRGRAAYRDPANRQPTRRRPRRTPTRRHGRAAGASARLGKSSRPSLRATSSPSRMTSPSAVTAAAPRETRWARFLPDRELRHPETC